MRVRETNNNNDSPASPAAPAAGLVPLYKRLPHGPHQIPPEEVTRNQRIRMHGAMIEAVAVSGYHRTSVKQVVGLAGVSRRSFYEQFANKQDCFLATFDVIASRGAWRVGAAYRAAHGDLDERLHAAFGELGEALATNWKGAGLVMVEAPKLGAPGLMRLRKASATFEGMLSECFERAPGANALPGPVIRGIAGGLRAAMSMCLREGSADDVPELVQEMFHWTLLFNTPAADRLATRLKERAREALQQGRKATAGPTRNGTASASHTRAGARAGANGVVEPPGQRERLLHQALRLSVEQDYRALSAPEIADAAGVRVDAFFELFDGKDDCFLAALEMLGTELLSLTDDPRLQGGDWPRTVRRTVGELMGYLAANPVYASTLAGGAFAAGPEAIKRSVETSRAIAARLVEGAPGQAQGVLAIEGIAGAIEHTVRCQVASGQIQLLSVLSDYLSYIVLAPVIGAGEAATVLVEDDLSDVCEDGVRQRR